MGAQAAPDSDAGEESGPGSLSVCDLLAPSGARYDPSFVPVALRERLFLDASDSVEWQQHSISMFGRTVLMPRQIAWFGEFAYGYSGVVHPPSVMPDWLRPLRTRIEAHVGQPFNGVLLNLYRDGTDSMGWHSDDDYESGQFGGVASVSLGAQRRFRIRSRREKKLTRALELADGSLLWMPTEMQREWQHAIPRTRRSLGARINMTFRFMLRSNVSVG